MREGSRSFFPSIHLAISATHLATKAHLEDVRTVVNSRDVFDKQDLINTLTICLSRLGIT